MYLLLGVVGYALIFSLLALAAHFGAVLAARALGVAPFRWFGVAHGSRIALVRVASSLSTLVAAMLAVFVAALMAGETTQTLNVTVLAGPAQEAGIRSGDRIVSVDGRTIQSFDALRDEIRRHAGVRQVEVERAGQRLTFPVTPRDGRIAVSAGNEQHPIAVSTALTRALETPWMTVGYSFGSMFHPTQRTELMGPVSIVRTLSAQNQSGNFAMMLALLMAFLWPVALGVHCFDALTGWLFRSTHSFPPALEADVLRLARLHQTLWICLMTLVVYLILLVIQKLTSFGDDALLGIFLLGPAALSGVLLTAFTLTLRSGPVLGLFALLSSATIPCAILGSAAWAIHWLRAELRRRGFEVRGLVAVPPTAQL